MSAAKVATVDPENMLTPDQSHCAHCSMHIVLNDAGKWMHTMAGIYPCQPAWRPLRRAVLTLLRGGRS